MINNDWVIGHVRNRENRRQQHRENRSAHVTTIGAIANHNANPTLLHFGYSDPWLAAGP